jgi:hypothetical protein
VTSSNVIVNWQSVPGVNYFVEHSTGFDSTPVFSLVATNISGQSGTNYPGLSTITSFTDTNAPGESPAFYRVGVKH